MSTSDILMRWLARAASRSRLNERLQQAIWLVITLLALVIVYLSVDAGLGIAQYTRVMLLLCLAAGAAAIMYFGWRMAAPPQLVQAAAHADARAGLRNELRSALWFVPHERENKFIRVHLERAARTVQRLDMRQLFPLVMPRNLPVAFVLALFAGVLLWVSPHIERTDDSSPAARSTAARAGAIAAGEVISDDEDIEDVEAARDLSETAWQKIENLARELASGPHTGEVAQAIAARDAKTAARLLAGMRRTEAARAASVATARPQTEQLSASLAKGMIERIQSLLNDGGGGSPQSGAQDDSEQPLTEQVRRELREEMDDAQQSRPGERSPEEEALNTLLLAMSRDSTGGREIVRGESDLMQGAGRTSVGSGAMGRRISNSTGGAGSGEQPRANTDGNAQAEPVLGRKTMRLRTQLQAVKIDSIESEDRDSAEESFYAATQAQAAKSQYETVTAVRSGAAENVGSEEQLPLAYRDAVRRYTLRQHLRDEQHAAQERAAR